MSETKKDNSNNKSRSDDYPLYFLMLWIPIVMILIISPLGDNIDPNSLLTDEQKLEKQKEIELKKLEKEEKWQEDTQWWKSGINYILVEKPMPYTMILGIAIMALLIKSFMGRRRHYDDFYTILNLRTFAPISLMTLYIFWVTGYLGFKV